jgi:hypothetical protein
MHFVYLHIALFAVWMILIEEDPRPTLTMIVSLEAIFLSTFVMISQNRADEKRQVMAGQEWQSVQLEEQQNEQLLDLSKQIPDLTDAIHRLTVEHVAGSGPAANSGNALANLTIGQRQSLPVDASHASSAPAQTPSTASRRPDRIAATNA